MRFNQINARSMPLPVGQLYWPSWEKYEEEFQLIFSRQYYTNHGPLVQKLEYKLCEYFGVKHVICVTNATIGLIMGAEALELRGKVITPSFTFIATPQALTWCGIVPIFCDVDPVTHQIDLNQIDALITPDVTGILAVNLWGNSCKPDEIVALAKRKGLRVFFDSAHAFGCRFKNHAIGNFGDLEVFSFHATKVFSSCEGGCITTNDDALATKLRNIRSSYGAGDTVSVVKTSNGRMSEAHAAIGLLNLDALPSYLERNKQIFTLYEMLLRDISGLSIYIANDVQVTNYQYVICEINDAIFGISRDELVKLLISKNIIARRYFTPGSHRSLPYLNSHSDRLDALPITDFLNSRLMQLPSGSQASDEDVRYICNLIRVIKDEICINE
jgi:dTDP-4-amino-4,6-dideoxygalactose transaminase